MSWWFDSTREPSLFKYFMQTIKFRVRSISTLPVPIIGYEWISNWRWYHQYIWRPVSEWQCHWIYQREQFTCLLDKNWKEIYEGDILEDAFEEKVYQTKWCDITAGFVFENVDDEDYNFTPWVTADDGEYSIYTSNTKELEIIWNIYENPELLK